MRYKILLATIRKAGEKSRVIAFVTERHKTEEVIKQKLWKKGFNVLKLQQLVVDPNDDLMIKALDYLETQLLPSRGLEAERHFNLIISAIAGQSAKIGAQYVQESLEQS